ncbi:MAG: ABC transporter substrate-binding protein, partial [Actinomycetota bacterium]|nr:ABC transporter substrate-binding protein [Actinomycetota bacterium]
TGSEGSSVAGGQRSASAGGGGGGKAAGSGPSQSSGGSQASGAKAGVECAPGRNGGTTDVGVSGTTIKLAATIVADGPGASFLGAVRTGMTTVVKKVNSKGGICGRRLDLTLRNDSWDAERGSQYIKNFVEGDKVFALAVVPSSEGLDASDDYIRAKGVPVVGTDGMLIKQYQNPWIWPVATSTVSAMHIMAKNAHDRGVRYPAIVFDAKYHFGVEGAYAFDQAFKRLSGNDIPGFDPSLKSCRGRFCGIQPQKPSYATEAQSLVTSCGGTSGTPPCDFLALLLEPDTALAFLREYPYSPTHGMGGAQPLFTRAFAEGCKGRCDGMWVWTGYNPPIEDLASSPGVAAYVNDVRAESASADVANQFLEGGYLGMSLLVEAVRKVGPDLTRAKLKATLDSMTFDNGLSAPLRWEPGKHFANSKTQAFQIQYKQTFNGWRRMTGFLDDPWVGLDGNPGQ